MGRFRYSIASLIGVVAFVAVGVAALRASSDVWDSGVFGATLLILVASFLLAFHSEGRKKAFWLGFAIVGWFTLGASLVPSIAVRLPTTKGLDRLAAMNDASVGGVAFVEYDEDGTQDLFVTQISPPVANPKGRPILNGTGTTKNARVSGGVSVAYTATFRVGLSTPQNFVAIGHALTALILAFLGGHFSRYLADRNQRTMQPAFSPSTSEIKP